MRFLAVLVGVGCALALAQTAAAEPSPFERATRLSVLKGGAGPNQSSITSADFDEDGRADIAIADVIANAVTVLRGRGDGTFDSPVRLRVGIQPYSVGSADFNADGHADLVAASTLSKDLHVLEGRGDGTFKRPYRLTASGFPDDMAVADVNADGRLDVVALNAFYGKLDVYLNRAGVLVKQPVVATGGTSIGLSLAVTVADLDGDGDQDIALAEWTKGPFGSAIRTLRGAGDGTFARGPVRHFPGIAESLRSGDVNCDGLPDLVVPVAEGGIVIVHGSRTDTIAPPSRSPGLTGTNAAELADLNGDGKLDMLISYFTGSAGVVSDVCGRRRMWPSSYLTTAPQSEAFGLPDLNGDGFPDLVEAGWFSPLVSVALNRGLAASG